MTYAGSNEFSLYIDDITQNWSHTTDGERGQTPARSSAEVIAEAPCCTFLGGILPLTNFGTMNFTGSTANGRAHRHRRRGDRDHHGRQLRAR